MRERGDDPNAPVADRDFTSRYGRSADGSRIVPNPAEAGAARARAATVARMRLYQVQCDVSGETDLDRLLAGLTPILDPVEYGFESVAGAPPLGDAFALIREAEGVTVIRPGTGWARITLGVPFQP